MKKTQELKKGKRKMVAITNGMDWFKLEKDAVAKGFFIEVMKKDGAYGEQEYAVLEKEDGEQLGMPSSKVLNDFFKTCAKGRYVEVHYLGKKLKKGQTKLNKKGNNAYHDFLIEAEEVA